MHAILSPLVCAVKEIWLDLVANGVENNAQECFIFRYFVTLFDKYANELT